MSELRTEAQEAAEDIFFGQSVIIWARWFVIIAGVVVVLWSSSEVAALTLAVLMILPLIAINFFVYGRYLMEKPINQYLMLGLSVVDLIVVTLIVLFMGEGAGYNSEYYVFFFPLLLAVAFVFPLRISTAYTLLGLLMYVGACLLIPPASPWFDSGWTSTNVETLVVRLIALATVGLLGAFYWRIQRNRRREAGGPANMTPAGM